MRLRSPFSISRALLLMLGLAVAPLTEVAAQGCASTVAFSAPARIGTQITMTISGSSVCHSCLWISKNSGPTQIGSITIPIGLPVLNALDYGPLPASGQILVPISIPNNPNLIGLQLFFTNVSFPSAQGPTISNIVFSPAAVMTFVP